MKEVIDKKYLNKRGLNCNYLVDLIASFISFGKIDESML